MPRPARNDIRRTNRWLFTLNNWTQEEYDHILTHTDQFVYAIIGKEHAPTTGTPHLQGFIRFRVRKTFNAVKNVIGQRAHLIAANGTDEEQREYCRKEGDFWEHGEPVVSERGRRRDIEFINEWVDQFINTHSRAPTSRELTSIDAPVEINNAYLRYNRRLMDYIEMRAPQPALVGPEAPRLWQTDVNELLSHPADTRTITFIVDPVGNSGKTWFQSYWFTHFPDRVQLLAPGRFQDMAYTIEASKDIFFLDLTRSYAADFHGPIYRLLECLKDKKVHSTKYEPKMILLHKNPHVMVFMNEEPQVHLLSRDRIKIGRIRNGNITFD